MQDNWELVLLLATDVSRPQEGGSPSRDPGHPVNAAVRRAALQLIEAVLRGGHVAPWTAIPALVTLTTDPNRWTTFVFAGKHALSTILAGAFLLQHVC